MEPIFADTLQLVANIPQERSIRYKGLLNTRVPPPQNKTIIQVKNEDCLDACMRLVHEQAKVGLLNMASDRCPGGGVKKGSRSQEEDVCRRTSLYPTLVQQRYPLAHDEVIFTPNVKVVKAADYSRLSHCINIAGVVSVAAIRLPHLDNKGEYMSADLALMKNKVRMVLETFEYHGMTHLVLGAWGCGAFRNPPWQVAEIFKDILKDFSFCHVTFAITTRRPKDHDNLTVFSRVFT